MSAGVGPDRLTGEVPVATGLDRPSGGGRRRGGGGGRGGRGGGRRRPDIHQMVPDAEFSSYYGRQIVKPSPWQADIPAYLFLGGLAGGSSLLGAGAMATGRPVTARAARVTALVAITGSFAALVHDLGRPSRFVNMLRVMKPTSPMSVGTWLLAGYGPMAGLAGAVSALPSRWRARVPLAGPVGDGAAVVAALVGPAVASYTAVLLSDTATPTWHESWPELPVAFVGSAAAAAGGMGLLTGPLVENTPARRMAVAGAVVDLVANEVMQRRLGLVGEPLKSGTAGMLMKAAKTLTVAGAAGVVLGGRRSRVLAAASGAALLTGSVCTRFGIFYAGQASAADPKYTVVPQRARVAAGGRIQD